MRYPSIPGERAACQRAERWLQALDDGFERANIDAKHPAAEPLQMMDRDLRAWERAIARGFHDPVSVGAASRVVHWLQELETTQKRANRSRRGVTRALTR